MNARLGAWLKRLDPRLARAACAVGRLVGGRRAQPQSDEPLIVRPGGMGDLICAHLALERLGIEVETVRWLIEDRSEPWARHAGLHYETIAPPRLPAPAALVIDTEQRFGLSLAYSLMARPPAGRLHAFATNRGSRWADTATPYDPLDTHEVESFTQLFAAAFQRPRPAPLQPIPRRWPATGGLVVGIAGRQEPTRALSVERWAGLVAHFTGGKDFALVAAPTDAPFAEALAARFDGRATLHRGNFTSVCELIARSEAFLTIDGGLVHVASYYGIPTTAIFTGGRERKWAPLGVGSVLIRRHDLPCQPCTLYGQTPPCPRAFACHGLDPARNRLGINLRNRSDPG